MARLKSMQRINILIHSCLADFFLSFMASWILGSIFFCLVFVVSSFLARSIRADN